MKIWYMSIRIRSYNQRQPAPVPKNCVSPSFLSLSLFSSASRCCCAGPSLVGGSSLSLCHATLPAFPTGRWGRRKRERERGREKKRVWNNPSSDSWICEPFADADRALLVIFFIFLFFSL
ncbi:unnamed protein product, partial [Sphagnum jensenii]